MNKKNSELTYTQRLQNYYLQYEITDLDETQFAFTKKKVACNHQTIIHGFLIWINEYSYQLAFLNEYSLKTKVQKSTNTKI